jgi:serine/threonine protein kinase
MKIRDNVGPITDNQITALREDAGIWIDPFFPLGEGMNRVAYRAWRLNPHGEINTRLTVCVPKTETGNSVQNRINSSKRNRDEREAEVLKQVKDHPNLVKFEGTYNIEGATINVLEEADGDNLEEIVARYGKIKDQKVADVIVYQALQGLEDLHRQGYLHRDIKPSNLIVANFQVQVGLKNHRQVSAGLIKLVDFQYSVAKDQVRDLTMPTRGCSEYAERKLINALLTGVPAKSNEKSDLYGLGGTLYFMLTGENPADYKVIEDENGKEVEIDGKKMKVSLVRKSKKGAILEKLDSIEKTRDEKRIKKIMHKVPVAYRNFIYRCMTSEEQGFSNVTEAREYFEKLMNNSVRNLAYAGRKAIKWTAQVALPIAAGVVLTTGLIRLIDPSVRDPNRPRDIAKEMQEYREMQRAFYSPVKTPYETYRLLNMNKPISGEEAK